MRRFRFTIAGLLALVLFVGVGFAALREATDLWDSIAFTITLGLLLTAVLLAIHYTKERRAYWLGFALFGGVYLAASLIPPIHDRLASSVALAYLESWISGKEQAVSIRLMYDGSASTKFVSIKPFSPDGHMLSPPSPVRIWDPAARRLLLHYSGDPENFLRIGHSLLALVLAFVGGRLSRWLYAGQRGREQEHLEPNLHPNASDMA